MRPPSGIINLPAFCCHIRDSDGRNPEKKPFVHIWAVLRRLKRIRLKILVIIDEIKGKCGEFFSLFL